MELEIQFAMKKSDVWPPDSGLVSAHFEEAVAHETEREVLFSNVSDET